MPYMVPEGVPADGVGIGYLSPRPEMFLPWDFSRPSAWLEHAPFMGWLVGRHRPRRFVELGTHWGFSYFAACAAAEAVGLQMESIAVDTWEGDEQAGSYTDEVYDYVSNLNSGRFGEWSTLFRGRFDDAAACVADGSLDLLHIDGFHTYEAVSHDYRTWLPKMGPRGVILFHDVAERSEGFGVHRFWDEVSQSYPSFQFRHGHGLGVLVVGPETGADLRWLAAQDGRPVGDEIRLFFRQLGRAVSLDYGLETARGAAAGLVDLVAGKGTFTQPGFAGPAQDLVWDLTRAGAAVEERLAIEGQLRRELEEHRVARADLDELRGSLATSVARNRLALAQLEKSKLETAQVRAELAECQARLDSRVIHAMRAMRHPRATLSRRHGGAGGDAAGAPEQLVGDGVRRLFDPEYYLRTNVDLAAAGVDPWEHYLQFGAVEGRAPCALFDPDWYLGQDPTVAQSGLDPVVHYLTRGAAAGLDPIPEFDTDWYLRTYPDVAAAGLNPLLHFIEHGCQEGRSPGPGFDTGWYLRKYPDVMESGDNPLVHFRCFGAAEGRLPRDPDS